MTTRIFSRCWPVWMRPAVMILGLLLSVAAARAVLHVARPDYQNVTPENYTPREPGVLAFSGHLVGPGTPPASIPNGGGYQLRESSIGQPFAPYIPRMSTNDISQPYAAEVAAAALARLYPSPLSSKATIETGTNAFRYQWLLYAPDTDTGGVTRTVADFEGIANWFGNPERAIVDQQIVILVDALAVSPWDTTLRRVLLDCYTDRAVAEMQFNKCDLVELGKKRLGLTLNGQFIIDDEITLISNVVARLKGVLNKYNELFTRRAEGVEPADFDTRFPRGTPFGYYVFASEQPARNTMAPQFFNTNGTLTLIPDFDPVLKEVPRGDPEPFMDSNANGFYDAGEPFTDSNTNGLFDSGSVIFSGYKDYTTLLKVLGEYVQRSAEWARFLGMRRGPGDLTRARGIITALQKRTATDYALLRSLFAGVEFPPGDASGVNAALGAVERAFAESVNTRAFLQGSGNILGLDNHFMVFLQDGSGETDTYDLMKPLVYDDVVTSTPVKAALLEQAAARAAYENFRASVDQVVGELGSVRSTFDTRFEEITGYSALEANSFDGFNAKPVVGSELATVQRTIDSLNRRNQLLIQRGNQFLTDLTGATNAARLAEGIDDTIRRAELTYVFGTSGAWEEIHGWAGGMAASQAAAEAMYAAGEIVTATSLTVGAALGMTAAAGVINTGIQTAGAVRTSQRQQELDQASIGFQSALAQAEAPLTAQQTKLELGAIQRELFGARIEIEDNNTALAQATADRTRLLNEVQSIRQSLENGQEEIRGRFYADPIHLVRSDNAILKADAAFANAQRWMFYLIRALEYKWNQNFVGEFAGRDYDAGSIFKMRNAEELKDLFNAMVNFNNGGSINFSQNTDQFTVISLRNLLVPNPNVLDPFDPSDPGVRVDNVTAETVTTRELFRRKLRRLVDTNGNLVIPVNTTRLNEFDHPDFFLGPLYSASGAILREGRWHDVVRYVKVNLVYPSHVGGTPLAVSGKIAYSGLTLFRTRVAPCGLPANRLLNALDNQGRDIPGELIATPFRSYVNLDFTVPLFDIRDRKEESRPFARSRDYVRNLNPPVLDPLTDNYKFNAFAEYSVAATGWELTLFSGVQPTTPFVFSHPNVNLDLIEDIEFIVAHRSADREQMPVCP